MRPLQNITGGTAGLEAFDPMKTRIITSVVLVPLLLLMVLVLPEIVTAVAVGLMAALAAYELLYVTGLVKHRRLVAYAAIMAFLVCLWSYFGMEYAWGMLGLLVFWALLFAEMMHDHIRISFDKLALTMVAGILLPLLLSSIIRIQITRLGRYVVMVPFVMAFLPDTGAYFVGSALGKHKLAPVISPKKTVEGVIGGMLSGMAGMVIYALIVSLACGREVNYLYAVIYGLVGSVVAVFGDLSFSVIKRQTGIKDYGNIFPGHGGILDRFDSVMLVAPVAEVLLNLLPLVR